jgi:hypothetical protein
MANKSYLTLFTFFFLTNCIGNNSSGDSGSLEIADNNSPIYISLEDVLQKEEEVVPLSSIGSEIIYVPLETNDNSLLYMIDQVEYMNGNYVVIDLHNYIYTDIYLFGKDGKFIKRVAQRGGGPSDYMTGINNILVDPVTNFLYLICMSGSNYKVIKFDEKADYIDNFQVEAIRDNLSDISNREFIVKKMGAFTSNRTMLFGLAGFSILPDDTTTIYKAIEVDTLGRFIKKHKNLSPGRIRQKRSGTGAGGGNTQSLYTFNNDIRFIYSGNDTIFSIVKDSLIPYAILDLGKRKMPSLKENYIHDFDEPPMSVEELNKYSSINNVFENDNYFILYLRGKATELSERRRLIETMSFIYDKKAEKLIKLKDKKFFNDLDGGIAFFPLKTLKDNVLIGWLSAEQFKNEILSKDYDAQKAKYGDRFEKVYQQALSLKEDDNPVLMIVNK